MAEWQKVLDFWFEPEHTQFHFESDKEFDEQIRTQFYETWEKAAEGLLADWRSSIQGRLAEIIVLDQFSRNLFREDKRAYEQDKMALLLAQEAVHHKNFEKLSEEERQFALMPFMHSESLGVHEWAEPYFKQYAADGTWHFEQKHKEMIEEFGRYPYRNVLMGRESTEAEKKVYQKEW